MMPTLQTIALALLAALIFPVVFLGWLAESRPERIQRLRSYGMSQTAIAAREGITRHRVRRILAA